MNFWGAVQQLFFSAIVIAIHHMVFLLDLFRKFKREKESSDPLVRAAAVEVATIRRSYLVIETCALSALSAVLLLLGLFLPSWLVISTCLIASGALGVLILKSTERRIKEARTG